MKNKLDPRSALFLYGLVVTGLLASFVAGLYLGKNLFVEAQSEPVAQADQPDKDIQDKLDFYDDLVKEKEQPAEASSKDSESGGGTPADSQQPPEDSILDAESQDPPQDPSSARRASLRDGYTVQLSASPSAADAQSMIEKLREKGYEAMLVEPSFSGDQYYRVWVGKFETRQEAVAMSQRLTADAFETFVKKARFPSQ